MNPPVKTFAISQLHRGHGVSTAAYFLARALTEQDYPVLLADLTNRPARLNALYSQIPTRRLVIWSPPVAALRDITRMIQQAKEQVTGRASCIIFDIDSTVAEHYLVGLESPPIDFLILVTEHTTESEHDIERLASHFEPMLTRNTIGVVYTRVSLDEVDDLPQQTDGGLPVLGYWPADYRLAIGDDYDIGQKLPLNPYQTAINRMATLLSRRLALTRIEKS
jgi:hypothetical protein